MCTHVCSCLYLGIIILPTYKRISSLFCFSTLKTHKIQHLIAKDSVTNEIDSFFSTFVRRAFCHHVLCFVTSIPPSTCPSFIISSSHWPRGKLQQRWSLSWSQVATLSKLFENAPGPLSADDDESGLEFQRRWKPSQWRVC